MSSVCETLSLAILLTGTIVILDSYLKRSRIVHRFNHHIHYPGVHTLEQLRTITSLNHPVLTGAITSVTNESTLAKPSNGPIC